MGNLGIAQAQLNSASASSSVASTEVTDGVYRVTGLVGVNGATSQYSLAADAIELWRSTDRTRRYVAGTSAIINDIGTTGLNGRDQSTAFGANTFIHLYFVGPTTVTSSTLATRSSLVAPPTGPTLPSSETHWAYAGTLRLGASTAITPQRMAGHKMVYEDDMVLLSGGTSTAFVSVDLSAVVPPTIVRRTDIAASGAHFLTAAGTFIQVVIRPTGSTAVGHVVASFQSQFGSTSQLMTNFTQALVGSSQSFDYMVTSTSAFAYINMSGYDVPNGGE